MPNTNLSITTAAVKFMVSLQGFDYVSCCALPGERADRVELFLFTRATMTDLHQFFS